MTYIKNCIFLLFLMCFFTPSFCQTVPLTVIESEKIFEEAAKKIQKIMPRGVEIFLFPPYILYASEHNKKLLEKTLPITFTKAAKKMDYEVITINALKRKNFDIASSIIKNPGHDEIMSVAQKMQYDGVLMINIVKTAGEVRNVWSNKKKNFVKNEIYLFQANLYNPEDSTVYLRLSNFFFLDN